MDLVVVGEVVTLALEPSDDARRALKGGFVGVALDTDFRGDGGTTLL